MPNITRTYYVSGGDREGCEVNAVINTGVAVTLVDQSTIVALGLPKIESELPTLGQLDAKRKYTFGAYTLDLRLVDDTGEERTISLVAYSTTKASLELLLSNYTLQRHNIQINAGRQRQYQGVNNISRVELIQLEDLEKSDKVPCLLGHVVYTSEEYVVRI